ncbi:hypothetical protein D3C72_1293830 [compost metagenome]
MVDVFDRLIQTVDHANRQDRRQILGAPVLFAGSNGFDDRPRTFATTQFDAFFAELGGHRRQEILSNSLIDQQGLHRTANTVAISLGIERDALGLGQIGVGTDVNVADTVQMLDHWYAGITADTFDQATATARHDHVDVLGHGDHRANSGTVSGFDHLHHSGRQFGLGQTALNACGNRTVGMNRFRATAQNGRIAGLQAQAGSIDGHVGTGFVDDPDHAQRHAHLADLNARRTEAHVADRTDRIRQCSDLTQTDDHAVDARRGQFQTLQQCRFQTIGATGGQILLIGGGKLGARGVQGIGSSLQGAVFLRGAGTADDPGGFAGGATQSGHVVKNGLSHGLVWSWQRGKRQIIAVALSY